MVVWFCLSHINFRMHFQSSFIDQIWWDRVYYIYIYVYIYNVYIYIYIIYIIYIYIYYIYIYITITIIITIIMSTFLVSLIKCFFHRKTLWRPSLLHFPGTFPSFGAPLAQRVDVWCAVVARNWKLGTTQNIKKNMTKWCHQLWAWLPLWNFLLDSEMPVL